MPRSYSFTGSPYEADDEKIRQSLRYAEALQQQSLQPNQGQLVSGHYVAPSITQGLAKLGQAFAGSRITTDALKTSRDLATQRQQRLIDTLRGLKAGGDPSALLENPDTAGMGVQAMMAQRQAEATAQIDASQVSEDRRWREEQFIREQAARAKEADTARGFSGEQNALNRQNRLQTSPDNLTFEQRKELAGMRSGRAQPYYSTLNTAAAGQLPMDARTGDVLLPGIGRVSQQDLPSVLQQHPELMKLVRPQDDPGTQGQLASAKVYGKELGTEKASLNLNEAQLPQLEATVKALSEFGKKATYTSTGKALDSVRRQFGMDPREAAVARSEYSAMVDNQVLPLLRATFGAAFTLKEGETLRDTLGALDKSPAEKEAVLRAFIVQKKMTIETQQRALGANSNALPSGGASGTWNGNNRRAPTATDPAVDLLLQKYPPR